MLQIDKQHFRISHIQGFYVELFYGSLNVPSWILAYMHGINLKVSVILLNELNIMNIGK